MKKNTYFNQSNEAIKEGHILLVISFVMFFVLVSLLLYQRLISKPLMESLAATSYNLMDIRMHMYQSHLQLEEAIIAKTAVEMDTLFYQEKQLLHALTVKGSKYEMSFHYSQSELIGELILLQKDLDELSVIAKKRYENKSSAYAGSKSDQVFEAVFNHSIQIIIKIENILRVSVAKKLALIGNLLNILIFFTVTLFGWNLKAIYRYNRKNASIRRLLAAKIENLNFYRAAMNEHAIVSMTDERGLITYVNRKFEQISQYTAEELIGQSHSIIRADFHSDDFFKEIRTTIVNGNIWQGEVKNKAKDGSFYWVAATIVPKKDPTTGKVIKYLSIRTDITAIRALEAKQMLLHKESQSREQYTKTLLDSLTIGLAVCTLAGKYIYLNPALAKILGYTVDEIKGLSYKDITPQAYEHSDLLQLEQLERTGVYGPYEKKYIHKQGHYIPVRLQGLLIENNDNTYIWSSIEDITDIHIQQHTLQVAKEAAEKANRAKTDFLSSMSHELRTPLNAILGFGQLLESDVDTPLTEEQQENVSYILTSGKHLLELINDVLELSAIESGKLEIIIKPILLPGLIKETVDLMRPIANKACIDLTVKSDRNLSVNADAVKLKQILINLINNAIKYNKTGGHVSLKWYKKDRSTLRLNISDTGIGIPMDKQDKVFAAFNRLGQEMSTIEGTGVGLVVTKALVEAMQGVIGFESQEGVGTTFWIELPITDA